MSKAFVLFVSFCCLGCCKYESPVLTSNDCRIHSKYNGSRKDYFLWSHDALISRVLYHNSSPQWQVLYKGDTVVILRGELFNPYVKSTYVKKSKDTIYVYNQIGSTDSSNGFLELKDGLIVKEVLSSLFSNSYTYNSDNTLKKISGLTNVSYEYIDTSDYVNLDNTFYILSRYFKLNQNFKLRKKITTLTNGIQTTDNYKYFFNQNNDVSIEIKNNTDTLYYEYICK